jgi:hypothetical protein
MNGAFFLSWSGRAAMRIRIRRRLEQDLVPDPLSFRHGRAYLHGYQDKLATGEEFVVRPIASPS